MENDWIRRRTCRVFLRSGYITNGMPEKVIESFEQMPVKADNVLMTILFNACARVATPSAVTLGNNLLDRIPTSFFEHDHLANSALDMLMKFGQLKQAEGLWMQMKRRDSVSYAVLMNGYQSNGQPLQCLKLLEQMKKSAATMTDAIAVPLVGACAQIGIVSICRRVLEHIHLKPQNYPRLRTVLIDMWVRRISSHSFLTEREDLYRGSPAPLTKRNLSFSRTLNSM